VKVSGMCWTMTMGGISAGSAARTSLIASVPPVDAPIAITVFCEQVRRKGGLGRGRGRRRLARDTRCRFHLRAGGDANLVADFLAIALQHRDIVGPRLGQEVDGAQFEGLQGDFGAGRGQGRNHDHRHRSQAHKPVQELEAVHARHFHVQGQDVGIERLDHLARDHGIGRRADHIEIRCAADDLGQQRPHQCGVIDHEYLD
jgi:hypothetical protein